MEDLDPRNEIIQEIRRVAPNADNGELRSFLARFLFTGEEIFKNVADLSGGEKGRLALAKLIYSGVNVLVLDEPTNHLDIPSREALEAALDSYPGTILAVSHDRFFLDEISTQIFSFEENGETEVFDGNYTEFHDWKESVQSQKAKVKGVEESSIKEESNNSAIRNPQSAISKNQLLQIETRIKEIEAKIPQMEEALAKLTSEMSAPETIADRAKLQKISEKYQQKEKQIQNLYQEWEKLEAGI